MRLSPKQLDMLASYARGERYEGVDPTEFGTHGLWFRNRERVIEALKRKGLIDEDNITDAGWAVIRAADTGGEER